MRDLQIVSPVSPEWQGTGARNDQSLLLACDEAPLVFAGVMQADLISAAVRGPFERRMIGSSSRRERCDRGNRLDGRGWLPDNCRWRAGAPQGLCVPWSDSRSVVRPRPCLVQAPNRARVAPGGRCHTLGAAAARTVEASSISRRRTRVKVLSGDFGVRDGGPLPASCVTRHRPTRFPSLNTRERVQSHCSSV